MPDQPPNPAYNRPEPTEPATPPLAPSDPTLPASTRTRQPAPSRRAEAPDPIQTAVRQRSVLLKTLRIGFVIVLLSAALLRLFATGMADKKDTAAQMLGEHWYLTFGLAGAMAALFITIDLLTPTKKIATLVSVSVGLLVGVVATIVVSLVIDFLAEIYTIDKTFTTMFKILLGICLSYLGVTMVLQTQDDVRLVIPYVEFAKQLRGPRPLLLDSSALVDARFPDALQTGFFQAPIVIPRFVLSELQQLADSQDGLKRAKGRRALDIVARLQRNAALDVTVDPTSTPGVGVDQALIELAIRTRGMIVTTDSGLARVAVIQGGSVLNVNDLASSLRPSLAAGELVTVKLVKPGEHPGQAVGYLPDGTMVVAEDGAAYLNRDATLMVVSTLQTSAGRLVFARLDTADPQDSGVTETDPPTADPIPDPSSEAGATGRHQDLEETAGHGEQTVSRPTGPFPPRSPARSKNRFRNPRR